MCFNASFLFTVWLLCQILSSMDTELSSALFTIVLSGDWSIVCTQLLGELKKKLQLWRAEYKTRNRQRDIPDGTLATGLDLPLTANQEARCLSGSQVSFGDWNWGRTGFEFRHRVQGDSKRPKRKKLTARNAKSHILEKGQSEWQL